MTADTTVVISNLLKASDAIVLALTCAGSGTQQGHMAFLALLDRIAGAI